MESITRMEFSDSRSESDRSSEIADTGKILHSIFGEIINKLESSSPSLTFDQNWKVLRGLEVIYCKVSQDEFTPITGHEIFSGLGVIRDPSSESEVLVGGFHIFFTINEVHSWALIERLRSRKDIDTAFICYNGFDSALPTPLTSEEKKKFRSVFIPRIHFSEESKKILDGLSSQKAEKEIAGIRSAQEEIKEEAKEVKEELKNEIKELKEEIKEIKKSQVELKEELKRSQEELKRSQEEGVKRLESQFQNILQLLSEINTNKHRS